jgi:hypothetical protein
MQMNAYEIRTKILKMAKQQVNEEYYQRKDMWLDSVGRERDKPLSMKGYPEPPTITDVMNAAEKMYVFVKTQE